MDPNKNKYNEITIYVGLLYIILLWGWYIAVTLLLTVIELSLRFKPKPLGTLTPK